MEFIKDLSASCNIFKRVKRMGEIDISASWGLPTNQHVKKRGKTCSMCRTASAITRNHIKIWLLFMCD